MITNEMKDKMLTPDQVKVKVLDEQGHELEVKHIYWRYGWGTPDNPIVPPYFEITVGNTGEQETKGGNNHGK